MDTKPPDKDVVLKELRTVIEIEDNILRDVRQCLKESVDTFVNRDIGQLFKLAVAYSKCFKNLQITSKEELEKLLKLHFRNGDIQDTFEELHENEREWDDLLKDVDNHFVKDNSHIIKDGDEGPINIPLVDARTGDSVTLKHYLNTSSVILVLLRHFA